MADDRRSGRPGKPEESEEARWFRLLRRGFTKRCPRCGAGKLFRRWFHMVERCPRCGVKFEREPGFFVGAYLINFATSIILLFILCMAWVAARAADPNASMVPFFVVGGVLAIAGPIVCYPFARTVWSAIDLGMTRLEPDEEAEAATYAAASGSSPSQGAQAGSTGETPTSR